MPHFKIYYKAILIKTPCNGVKPGRLTNGTAMKAHKYTHTFIVN